MLIITKIYHFNKFLCLHFIYTCQLFIREHHFTIMLSFPLNFPSHQELRCKLFLPSHKRIYSFLFFLVINILLQLIFSSLYRIKQVNKVFFSSLSLLFEIPQLEFHLECSYILHDKAKITVQNRKDLSRKLINFSLKFHFGLLISFFLSLFIVCFLQ